MDVSIDLSFNNFNGICKLFFFDWLENNYFNKVLFRRSLVFIKSWCFYEGCILGSNISLLASYALETLVICVFNYYHKVINNEMDAFLLFFELMNKVDLSNFSMFCLDNTEDCAFKEEDLIEMREKYEKVVEISRIDNEVTKKMQPRIKIADPIFLGNNLGKSVSMHNESKIKKLFQYMQNKLRNVRNNRETINPFEYLNELANFFFKTINYHDQNLFIKHLASPKIVIYPQEALKERAGEQPTANQQNFIIEFSQASKEEAEEMKVKGGMSEVKNEISYPSK